MKKYILLLIFSLLVGCASTESIKTYSINLSSPTDPGKRIIFVDKIPDQRKWQLLGVGISYSLGLQINSNQLAGKIAEEGLNMGADLVCITGQGYRYKNNARTNGIQLGGSVSGSSATTGTGGSVLGYSHSVTGPETQPWIQVLYFKAKK